MPIYLKIWSLVLFKPIAFPKTLMIFLSDWQYTTAKTLMKVFSKTCWALWHEVFLEMKLETILGQREGIQKFQYFSWVF